MKKAVKIFLKIVLWLFVSVVVILLLIQTPPVQNFARKKVQAYLQKKLDTRFEIGHIYIGLPSSVTIENIYVEDRSKDTLLYGGRIKAGINLFKLFSNEIKISELSLQQITAKIKRVSPDSTFNFRFIIDAFASENKKQPKSGEPSAMKIAVNKLLLNDTRFIYDDTISGNNWTVHVKRLDARIKTIDPGKLIFDVTSLQVNGLVARTNQYKPLVRAGDIVQNDTAAGTIPVLNLGKADLKNIDIDYRNDVADFYLQTKLASLEAVTKAFDLSSRHIALDKLIVTGLNSRILLGKKEAAKQVSAAIKQEAKEVAGQNWRMAVNDLRITQSFLQFDNDNEPRVVNAMDYAHLDADNISLRASDLKFSGDSIATTIQLAELTEKSGFVLQQLKGDFLYTAKGASAENFLVQTPGTRIQHTIRISYPSLESLQQHIEQLQIQATLPGSYVTIKDVLIFAPALRKQTLFSDPSDVIKINARITGRLDNLVADVLQVSGFNNTSIDVAGTIRGLPSADKLSGNIHIRSIRTTAADVVPFLPGSLRSQFELPATMLVKGTIAGNTQRAQTDLNIQTSSGNLFVKGAIENYKNNNTATYNVQVRTEQLQAGRILKISTLQNITANLQVQGKGFDVKTADATLKGSIQSVGFKEYNYRDISIDGAIKNQRASGKVAIKDPNIHFAADMKADLQNEDATLEGTITIDSIKTQPLHLTAQQFIYRGQIIADIKNVNPDKGDGTINIVNSLLVLQGEKRLQLDTVQVTAIHAGERNRISLRSSIANASIDGIYKLPDIGTIFQQAIQPYFAIMPEREMIRNIKPYNFTVFVTVDGNPAIKIFMPSLQRLRQVQLNSHFASDSGWSANLKVPALAINTLEVQNLELQAGANNNRLEASTTIEQIKAGNNIFHNVSMQVTAADNKVNFETHFGDRQGKEKYALAGILQQPQYGTYIFSLNKEQLLNYQQWTVAADNSIRIGDDGIFVTNFILNRNFQQFSLKSRGDVTNSPVEAYFSSFQLATLAAFATPDSLAVNGTLDGEILFRDIMKQPVFSGDLTIRNLSFKTDTIGNVTINANNNTAGNIQADINVTGYGNDIAVAGNYYLKPVGGNDFNFDVDIKQLNPATLQGATMGAITNASGIVTGKFAIAGTIAKPAINGELHLKKTAFNLTLVNNYFRIEDETITVNREGIRFNRFTMQDSANNAANLDGMVYTTDFKNYRFDLSLRANNFRALNTTKKDNRLYYGKLYFSSNMRLKGTNQLPVIDGTITIEDKTDLTVIVPQPEPGVVQREGVVQFVDMDAPGNDSLFLNSMAGFDSLNTSDLKGLDISVNIEIKKEAVFGLVVDQANGDFLRMQGEGMLNGAIDQSGKITLAGSYEIESGTYELTFNFLRRKFNIQKGSRIVWTGEPTKADVNVTAIYIANTNPLDLVKNQLPENISATERNTYLQRIPFEVLLNLRGELLQPQVTFDIRLPENKSYDVSNDIITTAQTKLEQLRQEPSEMNKQVFALLLLNRFVTENPFETSGGLTAESFARQSASKLLTEQLNRLAADLVQGVDVNFNVESTDDYTTGTRQNRTELNIALSKRLLNDRLTVTVGSNFELEGPQASQQQQDASGIIGNIELKYSLSKDGRYLLRAYRKNEYEGVIDGYVIETGVGFVITLDYNRFRNIFLSKKGREERRERRRNTRQVSNDEKAPALKNEGTN